MLSELNLKKLDGLKKYYQTPQALVLPALWMVQEEHGFISEEAMKYVSQLLNVPYGHILGVVTFYTMFHSKPIGKHHIEVCTNVSCMLRGSGRLVEHLEKRRSWWLGHIGYAVTPQEFVWKLGATADLEEAAFWAMAATGAHGVRLIGVRPGELVVVIGQGLIGQMSAQMARLRGATVIATDMIQKRVDLSVLHSADVAINGRKESLLEVVREYQPEGADVVIDTSGDSRMFDFLLELIREEGRICLQGYYPDPFRIEFHPTHKKRATVAFPCGNEDSAKIVPLLNQHKVRLKPLITHRFRARQAKEAYDLVLNRPEESLGILLEWT